MRVAAGGAFAVLSILAAVSCLPDDSAWKGRLDYAPDPDAAVTPSDATTEGGDADAGDAAVPDGEASTPVYEDLLPNVVRGRIEGLAVTPAEALVRLASDDAGTTTKATFTLTESSGSCATPPVARACSTNVLTFTADVPATDAGILATGTYPIRTIGFSSSDASCAVTSYALTIAPGATVTIATTDGGVAAPADSGADGGTSDAGETVSGSVAGSFAFEVAEGGRISGRFVAAVCAQR